MRVSGKVSYGKITLQIGMILIALLYLIPIYMAFNYSLKSSREYMSTTILQWPQTLNFNNFTEAAKTINYFRTLSNTVLITFLSVIIVIIVSSMASYTMARKDRKIYKGLYLYFLSGILLPVQAIFVPLYIVGKNLGFINNIFGVVFLYVSGGIAFGTFMMTGFMKTIPIEIEEAAIVDGCSVFRTYWTVVFPLLKPAAATLAILSAFNIWNDFIMPLLFLTKGDLQTLTIKQFGFFQQYRADYSRAYAGIILSTAPIVILFAFLQKYFIKGIAAGAVKG